MKAVVACGFFGPAAPFFVGFEDVFLRVGDDEVDDGGVAPGHACGGAGEEVVHGGRAHKRQLHMGMRVDAAGHDVLAASVHHRGAGRGGQAFTDGHDLAVLGDDIGAELAVGIDDGAATDMQ